MIVESGKEGKVVDYDEDRNDAYIDYKHLGRQVYLPFEQANGKDLEDGDKVTFDIEMKDDEPHATNVKRK